MKSAIKPYSSLHKYTVSYLESCYRVSIFVDTQTGYHLDSVLRRARESMTRLQCYLAERRPIRSLIRRGQRARRTSTAP